MAYRKLAICVLVAAFAGLPATGNALDLFKKDTMSIPKNSRVTVKGSTARIKQGSGGTGVVLTVQCACDGAGTCTVSIDKETLSCYKGVGATCNSSCELRGTTTSLGGGGMSMF